MATDYYKDLAKKTEEELDELPKPENLTQGVLRMMKEIRMEEIKSVIRQEQEEYARLLRELEEIENEKMTEGELLDIWKEMERERIQSIIDEEKYKEDVKERDLQFLASTSKLGSLSLSQENNEDEGAAMPPPMTSAPLLSTLLKSTSQLQANKVIVDLLAGNNEEVERLTDLPPEPGIFFAKTSQKEIEANMAKLPPSNFFHTNPKATPTLSMLLENNVKKVKSPSPKEETEAIKIPVVEDSSQVEVLKVFDKISPDSIDKKFRGQFASLLIKQSTVDENLENQNKRDTLEKSGMEVDNDENKDFNTQNLGRNITQETMDDSNDGHMWNKNEDEEEQLSSPSGARSDDEENEEEEKSENGQLRQNPRIQNEAYYSDKNDENTEHDENDENEENDENGEDNENADQNQEDVESVNSDKENNATDEESDNNEDNNSMMTSNGKNNDDYAKTDDEDDEEEDDDIKSEDDVSNGISEGVSSINEDDSSDSYNKGENTSSQRNSRTSTPKMDKFVAEPDALQLGQPKSDSPVISEQPDTPNEDKQETNVSKDEVMVDSESDEEPHSSRLRRKYSSPINDSDTNSRTSVEDPDYENIKLSLLSKYASLKKSPNSAPFMQTFMCLDDDIRIPCLKPINLPMIEQHIENGTIKTVNELFKELYIMCYNVIWFYSTIDKNSDMANSFLAECKAMEKEITEPKESSPSLNSNKSKSTRGRGTNRKSSRIPN